MPKEIKVQLSLVDKISRYIEKVRGKINKIGSSVDKLSKQFFNLRNAVAAFMALQIGSSFINAAAKIEVFEKQLLAVSSSAEAARNSLNAIREFARTSPLETEDVVQSFVRLRAVGIDPTLAQMRTIGGVAVLFDREMTDVLDSFIGLNKRTLRQLGIEIDRTGSQAIIQSGNIRMAVNKDSASIREALLEIWEKRFPNAIEKAADTFSAQMAILRSNIFEFQAQVGVHLLPMMKDLTKATSKWVEEGSTGAQMFAVRLMSVVAGFRLIWYTLKGGIRTVLTGITDLVIWTVTGFKTIHAAFMTVVDAYKALGSTLIRMVKEKRLDVGTIIAEEFKKVDWNAIAEEWAEGNEKVKRVNKVYVSEMQKDLDKMSKMMRQIQAVQFAPPGDRKGELTGTGALGAPGVGDEKAAAERAKKITAERLKIQEMFTELYLDTIRDQFERERAIVEAEDAEKTARVLKAFQDQLITEEAFDEALILIAERTAAKMAEIKDKELEHTKRVEAGKRREAEKTAREKLKFENQIWTQSKRLTNASIQLGKTALEASRAAGKKKKGMLYALALADAGAAAVAGVKSAMDLPFPANLLAGVATVLEVAALTISSINQIKNASFARGTQSAPGGPSIVGEEGPEMLNLPPGTRVYTAAQTRQIIGATIAPQIIIQGNADESTVDRIYGALDTFGRQFSDAIRFGHIDLAREGIVTR